MLADIIYQITKRAVFNRMGTLPIFLYYLIDIN